MISHEWRLIFACVPQTTYAELIVGLCIINLYDMKLMVFVVYIVL